MGDGGFLVKKIEKFDSRLKFGGGGKKQNEEHRGEALERNTLPFI